MAKSRYRDVSGDPKSSERAADTVGAADVLREAGFEVVGFIEDRLAQPSTIHEVMRSPDGTAFALPESLFGFPHVVMRTLLDDGTIIETSYRRRGLIRLAPSPRVSHSVGGYELRHTEANVDAVMQGHRRHVQDVVGRRGSNVGAHDGLALYIVIGDRATKLFRIRMMCQFATLPLAVGALFLGTQSLELDHSGLGDALMFAALMFAAWAGMWLNPGRWVPVRRTPRDQLLADSSDD